MEFNLPVPDPSEITLKVNGRRGDALLHFSVNAAGKTGVRGFKKLVISGIREYDKPAIDSFVENYLARMESVSSPRSGVSEQINQNQIAEC